MNDPKFTFNEGSHKYFYDGKPLTGVTTVLSVIAKPALIQWAANMACDFIQAVMTEGKPITLDVIKEARAAHRKKKEAAGQKGTDVHAEIEKYIKLMIADQDGKSMPMESYENPMVQKFVEWAVDNKVQFLMSEKRMYSPIHWLAGTADFTCIIDGKKYIGDLKTSNALYYEMFMQCAAYRLLLEEMGETDFHGSILVRVGKDGSFETQERYDYETEKEAFLHALGLYKILNISK